MPSAFLARIASLKRLTAEVVASAELLPLWPVLEGGPDRSARGERQTLIRSASGKKALVDELAEALNSLASR